MRAAKVSAPCVNELESLGEERIANELWLKLGLRVSPPAVRRYLPNAPAGRPRGGSTVVDIPEEPCGGHRGLRLLRGRNQRVSIVVCVGGNRAAQSAAGSLQRDVSSERELDRPTASRRGRVPEPIQVSYSRSRQHFCARWVHRAVNAAAAAVAVTGFGEGP